MKLAELYQLLLAAASCWCCWCGRRSLQLPWALGVVSAVVVLSQPGPAECPGSFHGRSVTALRELVPGAWMVWRPWQPLWLHRHWLLAASTTLVTTTELGGRARARWYCNSCHLSCLMTINTASMCGCVLYVWLCWHSVAASQQHRL